LDLTQIQHVPLELSMMRLGTMLAAMLVMLTAGSTARANVGCCTASSSRGTLKSALT